MPKLKNEQHELYCQAIFSGKNQTNAAIAAGYSEKCAVVQGSRLLTYVNIRTRIAELNDKLENKNIASVAERKEILSEIMRGRLASFVQTDKDGEAIPDIDAESVNSAALKEITTTRTVSGQGKDKETRYVTKVKLHGPVSAVQELNKMEGEHAPQKVQHSGNIGVTFEGADKEL